MTKKKVTIHDVAEAAGVSTTTVSRVLNGIPDCSKPVEERIRKAARELGYRASYFARGMKGKSTNILGLIIPIGSRLFRSAYFSELFTALEQAFSERGFKIMVMISGSENTSRFSFDDIFSEPLFDGFVVIAPDKDEVLEIEEYCQKVPIVVINGYVRGLDMNFVDVNNVDGVQQAVIHFASMGRKHIAYIGGPSGNVNEIDRFKGFRQGLNNAGLALINDYIKRPCNEGVPTEKAVNELLSLSTPPDALYTFNDTTAIDAIRALKQHGKKIPDDIAVIGFDNSPQTTIVEPTLTTIRPPYLEMSRAAVKLIIETLKSNEMPKHRRKILKPDIIFRNSAPATKQKKSSKRTKSSRKK